MKLKTLIQAQDSLKNLQNINFPAIISFKLAKVIKKLNEEIDIYNKTQNELLVKYGTPTDKPNTFSFNKENAEIYTKELQDLQEIDLNLEIEKFPFSILEGKEISTKDAINLEFLFEDAE